MTLLTSQLRISLVIIAIIIGGHQSPLFLSFCPSTDAPRREIIITTLKWVSLLSPAAIIHTYISIAPGMGHGVGGATALVSSVQIQVIARVVVIVYVGQNQQTRGMTSSRVDYVVLENIVQGVCAQVRHDVVLVLLLLLLQV